MPFIVLYIVTCLLSLSALPSHADYEIPIRRASLTSFPHKLHQKNLGGCSDCHGSKSPGPIDQFGEKWAHTTCMGCHSEIKSGPTECSGCHTQF